MAFLAQLGPIEFDVVHLMDLSHERSVTWAQHVPVLGRPRLEPGPLGLETMRLRIAAVAELAPPAEMGQALRLAQETKAPLPLVWASGETQGEWVIQGLSTAPEKLDPAGRVEHVAWDLELLEYVDPDPQARAAREQRTKALATLAAARPPRVRVLLGPAGLASRAPLLGSFAATVAKVQGATRKARAVLREVSLLAKDPSRLGRVARSAAAIVPGLASAAEALEVVAPTVSGIAQAPAIARDLHGLGARLADALASGDLTAAGTLAKTMARTERRLGAATAPLVGRVAARVP